MIQKGTAKTFMKSLKKRQHVVVYLVRDDSTEEILEDCLANKVKDWFELDNEKDEYFRNRVKRFLDATIKRIEFLDGGKEYASSIVLYCYRN